MEQNGEGMLTRIEHRRDEDGNRNGNRCRKLYDVDRGDE
jgi:hypothetical protein